MGALDGLKVNSHGRSYQRIEGLPFSLENPKREPVVLDDRKTKEWGGENLALSYSLFYQMSVSGEWLIGWTRSKCRYWTLSDSVDAEGNGDVPGLSGEIIHHIVAGKRLLILMTHDGRLFAVDLRDENGPKATEFFKVVDPRYATMGEGGGRFYVATQGAVRIWTVESLLK